MELYTAAVACGLGELCAEWLAFAVPGVAVAFGWHTVFDDKIFAVWRIGQLSGHFTFARKPI
jgi:hypothetical protein